MAVLKKYYKNSNTGDILCKIYSEKYRDMHEWVLNAESSVCNPDMSGFIEIKEKLYLKIKRQLHQVKTKQVNHL